MQSPVFGSLSPAFSEILHWFFRTLSHNQNVNATWRSSISYWPIPQTCCGAFKLVGGLVEISLFSSSWLILTYISPGRYYLFCCRCSTWFQIKEASMSSMTFSGWIMHEDSSMQFTWSSCGAHFERLCRTKIAATQWRHILGESFPVHQFQLCCSSIPGSLQSIVFQSVVGDRSVFMVNVMGTNFENVFCTKSILEMVVCLAISFRVGEQDACISDIWLFL